MRSIADSSCLPPSSPMQGQRQEMEQHVAHRHSSSLPQMPTASTPAKKLTNDDILSLFDAAPSPHFARTPPPRHPQAFPGHAHAVHASASPLGAHQPYAGVSGTPHAPANTPARMQVPHGAGMGHGGAGVGGAGMLGPGLAGGSGLTPLGGGSGVGVGSLVGAGTGGGASAGQGGGTGPSWSMAPPQGGSGTGGSGNGAVWSLSAHKQGQTTAGGHGGGLW